MKHLPNILTAGRLVLTLFMFLALAAAAGGVPWVSDQLTADTQFALLRWAFETLDLNRVQAEADTRNAASARVLEKMGFVREGTLREDCVVNGDVSDSWVYGLLRREWRPSATRPLGKTVPHK